MSIEHEALAEDEAWKHAEEYAPGDTAAQDDFVQGYLTASRPASPATREAVARLLCEAEDSGTYSEDEGTCMWHLELADRLLAAFTITGGADRG